MININKKFLSILFLIGFFVFTRYAYADFQITEIMYDLSGTDTGREWIEVQNTGTEPSDLSKWYLFSDNSKHTLTPQGDSMVPAQSYAIICQDVSKFKLDWPNFSGLLFDSSWTGLNNENDSISLKDPDLNIVSTVTFNSSMGGSGDGNSIQIIDGSWIGASPTPGIVNKESQNQNNSQDTNTNTSTIDSNMSTSSSSGGGSSPVTVTKKEPDNFKINTKIITKNIVTAGIPFAVDQNTTGHKKEKLLSGKFVWNFGDGRETQSKTSDTFEYTYQYSGDYVLSLSYYNTVFDTKPESTDRVVIKVVPSSIIISSVGSYDDPYIELENNSNYEISLNGWIIKGNKHTFIVPEGLIVLPNKKIKLSPKITGFDMSDLTSITILNSSGEIFANYPNKNINYPKSYSANNNFNKVKSGIEKINKEKEVINLNDLGSSVINSNDNVNNKFLIYISFIGIILIGIVSMFLIRRRNNYQDYVEKDISAKDMTIIE